MKPARANSGDLLVLPDANALAAEAADRFVAYAGAAITDRGVALVGLAGGSSPRAMNALLASEPRRARVPWNRIRFFFGDERCVPPDDAESNYRMNRETLFEPLAVGESQIVRMRGEDPPAAAASAYEALLHGEAGQPPVLDVIFLGLGPDGHTASLFPGTLANIDVRRTCVENYVPKFAAYRITLTPRALNAARNVVVVAGGAEKADALAAVIGGPREPDTYPAQLLAPHRGALHWLADAAAAAKVYTS
ncbi:MAG: 6-phosphogluconolactonase [Candidatus Velthaea sp.]